MSTPKSKLREYIEAILLAIVIAFFIRTFIIQAYKIPSGSMKPTLLVGDHILVSKFNYGVQAALYPLHTDPRRRPQTGRYRGLHLPGRPFQRLHQAAYRPSRRHRRDPRQEDLPERPTLEGDATESIRTASSSPARSSPATTSDRSRSRKDRCSSWGTIGMRATTAASGVSST